MPEDYFNKERLDYIFILDEDKNDPVQLNPEYKTEGMIQKT